MKVNLPVTQHEVSYPDNTNIVSKTDLKGITTYVNADFVRISGFSEAELLGKNHNIVRHPDMPPAAFADLWETCKAGKPWSGIVKNRCKNGDHYWVEAHVTPLYENGRMTGYQSVRKKPSRAQVSAAENLYRRMNEGKSADSFLSRLFDMLKNITIKQRLISVIGLLSLLLAIFGMMCMETTRQAHESLKTVYNDRVVPLQQLKVVADMYAVNIVDTAHKTRNENLSWSQGLSSVKEAEKKIDDTWKAYISTFLVADEKKLIAEAQPLMDDANRAVSRLKDIMLKQDSKEIAAFTINELYPHIDPISDRISKLVEVQLSVAKSEYDASVARYEQNRQLTMALVPAGVLTAALLGFVLLRAITVPLGRANSYFERMAQGDLNVHIEIDRRDEIAPILEAAKQMQIKLGLDMDEMRNTAAEAARIAVALDNSSANVMVADTGRNIVYINKAFRRLFQSIQGDIRQRFPQFDVDRLVGQNIDQFHQNPDKQRHTLATFTNPATVTTEIGGRTFRIVASPVIDEKGERLGSVSEWSDLTNELAAEKDIAQVVHAAAHGDLSQRMNVANKTGFFKQVGESVNELTDTASSAIGETNQALGRIADGDLTARITTDYQGAFGEIKDNINATVERLTESVLRIKEATDAINTAAKEIATGNQDLSQRTEEQASSLEETASSMEELASTVKQNAENAKQASQMAAAASEVASRGGRVVQEVVFTMSAINDSSRKIVDIISVIDGIAFQTNILALNAAVEAARAGEQGRGFAVVAGEVRNLAQRSAAAAKEIKTLIGSSVDKVEDGAKLVETAGSTMEEIVTSVKRVTDIMAEIAAASVEQSSGIDQVNQAITQMDEVTQQNAALVEQAAAAAESLEEQSENLALAIGQFNLGVAARGALAAPRAQARSVPARPSPAASLKPPSQGAKKPAKTSRHSGSDEDEWKEF